MKCPACGNSLTQIVVAGVQLDVCRDGCGGIWFDNFELKKFDQPHHTAGEALLDIPRNPATRIDAASKRKCPKCAEQVMSRHFSSIKKQVELDACPACGGYWLDAGELALVREEFKTEQERQHATARYFNEISRQLLTTIKKRETAYAQQAERLSGFFGQLAHAGEV